MRGKRVLLVEDEALVAMELELAIENVGAEVIGPASTLARAEEATRAERIDAAILDINLNGQDVFPVADYLVARGIPFVFQTGHGQRRDLVERYPDVPICKKPQPSSAVLQALGEVVRRRSQPS
nr:response regulator [Parvularcula dongshanensis]